MNQNRTEKIGTRKCAVALLLRVHRILFSREFCFSTYSNAIGEHWFENWTYFPFNVLLKLQISLLCVVLFYLNFWIIWKKSEENNKMDVDFQSTHNNKIRPIDCRRRLLCPLIPLSNAQLFSWYFMHAAYFVHHFCGSCNYYAFEIRLDYYFERRRNMNKIKLVSESSILLWLLHWQSTKWIHMFCVKRLRTPSFSFSILLIHSFDDSISIFARGNNFICSFVVVIW